MMATTSTGGDVCECTAEVGATLPPAPGYLVQLLPPVHHFGSNALAKVGSRGARCA